MASLLLGAAVVLFDAALWLPCLSAPGLDGDLTYSGAHLIFVAVGSLFSIVSPAFTAENFEAWWLVPIANLVFLAAPWIWTAHPRSRATDRSVAVMKLSTALIGVWVIGNVLVGQTDLWAHPVVELATSSFPETPWRLEAGALTWVGSMLCCTAALIRRRDDQRELLLRWESRPGASTLAAELDETILAPLPPRIRELVIDARRLRAEFDAMGPIDGWRVRLIGDWLGQLCSLSAPEQAYLAQHNVWPHQLALAVTPDSRARSSRHGDRLDELIRIDDALHHFIAALVTRPVTTYR